MKKIAFFLIFALSFGLLAGCAGTPVVYYTECNCPAGSHTGSTSGESSGSSTGNNTQPLPASAVKTGLAILGNAKDSKDAAEAAYDITVVAVTVDNSGVIRSCIIDSFNPKVTFDASGTITSDLSAAISTKNELGDKYGMKAYGGAKYEWYEQAAALAEFAVGKTVDELKNGAIDESGKAPAGTDLASTATIYLGGYVSAIETAVANAKDLGAGSSDELRLAITATASSSNNATADKDGVAQLDCTATALTANGGTITSCFIDSLQAKVNFNKSGTITTDLSAPMQTKNQLGENYGMKAWGGAIAEWDEQAASFAEYVTGKTAAEVAGIAVNEKTAPTDVDLSTSVTISIGDFQSLIAKAMQ